MPDNRFRLKLDGLEVRATPATLQVDDDRGQFPAAPYTTIQSALDAAAAGDTVLVYPGTYAEKLLVGVDTNGWPLRLYGRSVDNVAIRSETPLAATITLPASAPAESALITVGYARGVTLDGFTIAGPGAYSGQLFDGVEVNQRASVTVINNHFTDIGDPGESGGQTGFGVYVGYDGGGSAVVVGNTFTRYQKGGVLVDGPFSSAVVAGNDFVGRGPTPVIAQNAIQFSNNATGQASGNFITGHVYTGDPGPDPENPTTATGIVVYQAGRVTITNNTLDANQTGIYVWDQSNTTLVQQNEVAGSTLDGITLDLARGSTTVLLNRVTDSGRDGIHIQSASHNNTVSRNTVTGSGRHGIASVPTKFGANLDQEAAPQNNVISRNVVTGSVAFDLYAQSASWYQNGQGVSDLWSGNTFNTRNRPGLR